MWNPLSKLSFTYFDTSPLHSLRALSTLESHAVPRKPRNWNKI